MTIRNSWLQLEPDEKILKVIKHHWLVIGRRFFKLIVLALAPLALYFAGVWFGFDRVLSDKIIEALLVLGG